MIAKEIISHEVPPLKTSDSGEKALNWMREFNFTHMPIVNNKQFLGLVSEEDIIDLSDPEQPLGNHSLSLMKPFVYEDAHIYEVIKVASELKLSLIPVIDRQENFSGCITLQSLIDRFAATNSLQDPGGVIMLHVNKSDYQLSEIARIVESNDASILCLYITSPADSTKLEVTIKVNNTDLRAITQTFERFEYDVTGSYQETEYYDDLKDRFDSLMNFINI